MKRLLVVLLSLGLIMGFSVSAFGIGADFSGQWYYRAWYINNPTLQDKNTGTNAISDAHFDQRLRMMTRFKVADGLTATLRLDAFEDFWQPATIDTTGAKVDRQPAFAWDHGYIDFKTVAGDFRVGYTTAYKGFGTDFNNSAGARPGASWFYNMGPLRVGAAFQRESENNIYNNSFNFPQTDKDRSVYVIRANYDQKKGLDFGGQIVFNRDASRRVPGASGSSNYVTKAYAFEPYVIAKFGQLNLQAEGFLTWGKAREFDTGSTSPDRDARGKGLMVHGKYNMGPAYVGAWFQYMSGDDPATADKQEGTMASMFAGGTSQIGDRMFFSGSDYYVKQVSPYQIPAANAPSSSASWITGSPGSNTFDNLYSIAIYGGYSVTPKLDLMADFYYLKVDEPPAVGWISKDFGKEVRLAASYKIFDNLSLSVDGVYFWTGDFFKGTTNAVKIDDNYYLVTVLNLTY